MIKNKVTPTRDVLIIGMASWACLVGAAFLLVDVIATSRKLGACALCLYKVI